MELFSLLLIKNPVLFSSQEITHFISNKLVSEETFFCILFSPSLFSAIKKKSVPIGNSRRTQNLKVVGRDRHWMFLQENNSVRDVADV